MRETCEPADRLCIALRDHDTERAKVIAQALHDVGHQVRVVCQTAKEVPWARLRQFAPHVFVIDDLANQQLSDTWMATMRLDAHLRHTAFLSYPLHLFARSHQLNLAPMLWHLQGLNHCEKELRSHLEPGREIELDLPQIGVTRLLRTLAEESCHVQLSARSGRQTLRWGLRDGHATTGVLEHGDATARLGPEDALDWLLAHPLAGVHLHVLPELSVKPRVTIQRLLADSFRTVPPPTERESGMCLMPPMS